MDRDVYKLKTTLELQGGEEILTDFWLDVNKIDSFYIPSEHPEFGKGITIEYGANRVTVLQESHIMAYLSATFAAFATKP